MGTYVNLRDLRACVRHVVLLLSGVCAASRCVALRCVALRRAASFALAQEM